MKKNLIIIAALLLSVLLLSACGCAHENWTSSENGEKICADCETLYCEINGHTWFAATCEEPKSCENCNLTEGDALGHNWTEATCETAKTCSVCSVKEGEAPGHIWLDATTEAPKTCEACNLTEGERIITDERFKTADTAPFVGTWEGQITVPCADLGYTGVSNPLVYNIRLTFGKAGEFTSKVGLASGLPMKNEVIRLKAEEMYAFSASLGKDKAAADAEMQALLGMSVTQYATFLVQNFTFTDPVTSQITGVYYVQEGQVHAATKWTDDMTAEYGYIEEGELLWTAIGSGYSCTLTQVAG